MTQLDRRHFLVGAAAAGAAAAVLDPVSFGYAAPGETKTRALTGAIAYGAPDRVYGPPEVPAGANRISGSYGYDRPTAQPGQAGNALDIGMFDPDGYDPGNARGFRGWSGGFRTEFTISNSDATPGYLPGPVKHGTWHVIVGPYTVHPQVAWTTTPRNSRYVRAEVRRPPATATTVDTMVALTNPIFLGRLGHR